MNKKNKMGSAMRRALNRFRRSFVAQIVSISIICAFVFLSVISVFIGKLESDDTKKVLKEAEPITLNVPEPCSYGAVTVYADDKLIYQYVGEIQIQNDGQNGEDIDVIVEYSEHDWPCTCFKE